MKKVGKYRLDTQLGKGAFSVVYHAVDTEGGGEYAVKMCEKQKLAAQNMLGELENEIAVLKKIKSRHIANLLDVVQTSRYYYLVLDLCRRTLFEAIVTEKEKRFSVDAARSHFQQLLLAVYSCHQQGVMHRDIKPENILLTAGGVLKLSDFGFACPVAKCESSRMHCGTRQYLAPEVFLSSKETIGQLDGFACDVWSCGVVLYVMVCGRLPFADHSAEALKQKVIRASPRWPEHLTPDTHGVIARILTPDPQQRPTIFEIMETEWFQVHFERAQLDDINEELRAQRVVAMPVRYSRHVPIALSMGSPNMVESASYRAAGSCGSLGSYNQYQLFQQQQQQPKQQQQQQKQLQQQQQQQQQTAVPMQVQSQTQAQPAVFLVQQPTPQQVVVPCQQVPAQVACFQTHDQQQQQQQQ
eukprot:Rhum_TRINITY_DN14612_c32_g1::Rhum_TRINITY_DN14612_c32_g1_i1::g.105292::m.105292